jgi:hypothetical protein
MIAVSKVAENNKCYGATLIFSKCLSIIAKHSRLLSYIKSSSASSYTIILRDVKSSLALLLYSLDFRAPGVVTTTWAPSNFASGSPNAIAIYVCLPIKFETWWICRMSSRVFARIIT